MKKVMQLILMVFTISFLISCASDGLVMSKATSEAVKIYKVNDQGTVEIIGQDMKVEKKHWLYVECDHWSGCYMRCQGHIRSCKNVAKNAGFRLEYASSSSGPNK